MEDISVVLVRASCLARAVAAAWFLSSLQLVRAAELVGRAAERCGYLDRGMELQETADLLSLADRQKMANAAALVSSAAAKAGQAAETSGRGPGELRQACQDLEMAARELSIAVASVESDSKLRDRSAESCNWICWRKKEDADQEQLDGGSLAEALLHHKPWRASTSAASSGVLDLAPGGHTRTALQVCVSWTQVTCTRWNCCCRLIFSCDLYSFCFVWDFTWGR
jgi:hypothetical protein